MSRMSTPINTWRGPPAARGVFLDIISPSDLCLLHHQEKSTVWLQARKANDDDKQGGKKQEWPLFTAGEDKCVRRVPSKWGESIIGWHSQMLVCTLEQDKHNTYSNQQDINSRAMCLVIKAQTKRYSLSWLKNVDEKYKDKSLDEKKQVWGPPHQKHKGTLQGWQTSHPKSLQVVQ